MLLEFGGAMPVGWLNVSLFFKQIPQNNVRLLTVPFLDHVEAVLLSRPVLESFLRLAAALAQVSQHNYSWSRFVHKFGFFCLRWGCSFGWPLTILGPRISVGSLLCVPSLFTLATLR